MKNMKIMAAVFSVLVLLPAALSAGADEMEVFEIKERMFIQQCDDIYFNTDEYLGKAVRLEGIFKTFQFPSGDSMQMVHFVYRKAPGCCGDDGMVGFRILPEDCPAPEQEAWVEATGKVEVNEWDFVVLRLSSLKTMDKRGAEFVRQ